MTTATFDNVKKILLKVPEEKDATNNLYIFLHVFSQIALNVMHKDFSLESIKKITLPDGDIAFDDTTANEIHTILNKSGDTIKNALELIQYDMQYMHRQRGGDPEGGLDRERILGALKTVKDSVDLDFLSIDGLYYKVTNFLDKLDEQNRALSQQMGVSKFINSAPEDPTLRTPPVPPVPPLTLKTPIRIFPVLINGMIEITRLCIALEVIPAPNFVQKLLGFAQALLDVARGRWKYGVLSLLGTLGQKMYFVSLILKLMRDVWTLIEPNLANQLRTDIFLSGKSIFIGFILRVFTIVAPDFIRKQFNEMLKPVNDLYGRINEQLEKIEEESNKVANPEGMLVRFPRIGTTSTITLDDIQSLQTIFSVPEVTCSSEIQAIVKSSRVIPPLRFLFEMMNIPIADQAVTERCRSLAEQPLSSTMVKMMKPQITLIPGGPMNMAERTADAAAEAANIPGAANIAASLDSKAKEYEKSIEPKDTGLLGSFGGIAKSLAGNKLKGVPGLGSSGSLTDMAKGMAGDKLKSATGLNIGAAGSLTNMAKGMATNKITSASGLGNLSSMMSNGASAE